jgi:mono/diheme cytochrome c family protein
VIPQRFLRELVFLLLVCLIHSTCSRRDGAGPLTPQLVTTYSAALGQKGDSPKGKALFDKHCASCHRVRDGHHIGPDLSGVSSNTKAQLLQSILDPSKTIDPR